MIEVSEVGLAAYIKISGGQLKAFNKTTSCYMFETEKSIEEWQVEYLNSVCYAHDTEVMSLRKFKVKKN